MINIPRWQESLTCLNTRPYRTTNKHNRLHTRPEPQLARGITVRPIDISAAKQICEENQPCPDEDELAPFTIRLCYGLQKRGFSAANLLEIIRE